MRVAIVFAMLIALSGCAAFESTREGTPIGVGGSADALKKGPCACYPVKMNWVTV